jgi:hypothetical protein
MGNTSAISLEDYKLDFSRMLYMLYMDMDGLIRQADTKAQIFLGVNAILAATIANVPTGLGTATFTPPVGVGASALSQIGFIMLLGVVLMLVLSVFFALATIIPRRVEPTHQSLYFYGTAARMDANAYIQAFKESELEDLKSTILGQIHSRAQIVAAKFTTVNLSGRFLLFGVLLWGASRLALAFA